jgi:hypothetical protein
MLCFASLLCPFCFVLLARSFAQPGKVNIVNNSICRHSPSGGCATSSLGATAAVAFNTRRTADGRC